MPTTKPTIPTVGRCNRNTSIKLLKLLSSRLRSSSERTASMAVGIELSRLSYRSWKMARVVASSRSIMRISQARPKFFIVPSSSTAPNTATASSSLDLAEASKRRVASSMRETSSARLAISLLSGVFNGFYQ